MDLGDEAETASPTATPIEEMLREGQEILVQVSKESLGSKGARITSFISIPGRYIVYMPQSRHIGVSRRIHDEAERERLREHREGACGRPAAASSSARWPRARARRSSPPTSSS